MSTSLPDLFTNGFEKVDVKGQRTNRHWKQIKWGYAGILMFLATVTQATSFNVPPQILNQTFPPAISDNGQSSQIVDICNTEDIDSNKEPLRELLEQFKIISYELQNTVIEEFIRTNFANNAENLISFCISLSNSENTVTCLSALHGVMQNDVDSYEMIKLAYRIKEYMNKPIPQDYKNKLIAAKDKLPSIIQKLIWNGYNCDLKNKHWGEYLYSPSDDYAYDSSRRRVFTWRPGQAVSDSKWSFETKDDGNTFTIKNKEYNEYLSTPSNDFTDGSFRRYAFTWRIRCWRDSRSWKIKTIENGQYLTLMSNIYGEYLYADGHKIHDDRRNVFTYKGSDIPGWLQNEYRWELIC